MSTTPPASVPPPGDDRNLVQVDESYLAPSFEDKVQHFWGKHRSLIVGGCVVVLAVILARGGVAWWQERQNAAVAAAYAEAKDDAGLKAFVAAHGGTDLAGVAYLQLADRAFTAGDFSSATTNYNLARAILGDSPLAGRLALGLAITQIKSGETDAGQAALQALADDATATPAIRAEAAYHLASLAATAGDRGRVAVLADRISTIEPDSSWSQRATILLTTLPATSAGAVASESGEVDATISFPSAP